MTTRRDQRNDNQSYNANGIIVPATIGNLVQFSDTNETLVFSKNQSFKSYDAETKQDLILNEDGTPIDYELWQIVPRSNGDYYIRIEALIPGLIFVVPDVGQVKITDVQKGHLITNVMQDKAVHTFELTKNFLNCEGRDKYVWVVTLNKDFLDEMDDTVCKIIYNWFGVSGASTVDFNDEKLMVLMNQELVAKMDQKNVIKANELINMFQNNDTGEPKWTNVALNYNWTSLVSKVAQQHPDRLKWEEIFTNLFTQTEANEVFKGVATTKTTPGGYVIYGNPLELFLNAKGYDLQQLYAKGMVGINQADQIIDVFLGEDRMNGVNNIIQKENSEKLFVQGTEYTKMLHSWDKAYGMIWGALSDSKTLTSGISCCCSDNQNAVGLYKSIYDLTTVEKHKNIAQELFDAFKKGRNAILLNDYLTRDTQICVIRRLLSRVILAMTLHHLDKAISMETQVGVLNAPSPDRIFDMSKTTGYLISCLFIHKDLNYLTIYDKEYNPYIELQFLVDTGILVNDGTKYLVGTSTWDLLDTANGIATLKTLKLKLENALIENYL